MQAAIQFREVITGINTICRILHLFPRFMIGCDYCSEWFHGNCVGVTEMESTHISSFKCPMCTSKCAMVPFYNEGKVHGPSVLYMNNTNYQ